MRLCVDYLGRVEFDALYNLQFKIKSAPQLRFICFFYQRRLILNSSSGIAGIYFLKGFRFKRDLEGVTKR